VRAVCKQKPVKPGTICDTIIQNELLQCVAFHSAVTVFEKIVKNPVLTGIIPN
jgi:hypothetical protein